MIDTTPGNWSAHQPESGLARGPRSAWRETVRWVVLVGLTVVLPMLLLSTTVAAHVEGCGGG